MSAIVALDVGSRTVGVARADRVSRMATPWFTLSRRGVRQDVDRLCKRWADLDVEIVVVGLPMTEDDTEQRATRLARQIGSALSERPGLTVHYQDEQYTTLEAERRLREAGISQRRHRELVDAWAAAVILEDWLAACDAAG